MRFCYLHTFYHFFSSRIYTYITNLIMQLLITLSFSLSLSLFIYQNKDTIKVQLQTQKKANLGLVGTNKANVNYHDILLFRKKEKKANNRILIKILHQNVPSNRHRYHSKDCKARWSSDFVQRPHGCPPPTSNILDRALHFLRTEQRLYN